MTQKTKPKFDDHEQSKRFIDMAREVETDDDLQRFDRTFKRIAPPKKKPKSRQS